jgi:hypothetical protein
VNEGAHLKVIIALEHLDGGILTRIVDIPVEDTGCCDKTKLVLADPLPELDILVHGAGLELLLLLEVEDLQCSRLSLESNDLSVPVHDGTVGLDRPTGDVVAILELDDNDLRLGSFVLLFSHTHVGVGLECLASS